MTKPLTLQQYAQLTELLDNHFKQVETLLNEFDQTNGATPDYHYSAYEDAHSNLNAFLTQVKPIKPENPIEELILKDLIEYPKCLTEPITLTENIRAHRNDIIAPDDYIYPYTLEQFDAFIAKYQLT